MPPSRGFLQFAAERRQNTPKALTPVNGAQPHLEAHAVMRDLSQVQRRHAFLYSNSFRARARAVIPGGSSDRIASDAHFPLLSPGFIARGTGCHVFDADGQRYIEYGAGCCPVGLGHAHPVVREAVEAALKNGDAFTRAPLNEPAAAEALSRLVPGAEMVRFFSAVSDAQSASLMLAFAATGRRGALRLAPLDSSAEPQPETTHIPATLDASAVSDFLTRSEEAIGAVVIDVAGDDDPAPGLLADIIATVQRHGALAVLDESTTGFRWSEGGAQGAHDCLADLSIFGSGAANGMPIAALTGSRPLMKMLPQLETIRHMGFLQVPARGAPALCLAALLAVIQVHRSEGVADRLHQSGRRLRDGVRERIQHHGLSQALDIVGRACRPVVRTCDANGQQSASFRCLLLQETIRRGVIMPTLAPSLAHDDAAISETLDAFEAALPIYARALEDGVGHFLVGHHDGSAVRRLPFQGGMNIDTTSFD